MSNSISTMLLRRLQRADARGHFRQIRRSDYATKFFAKTQYSIDPKGGVFRGREEIDRIAGMLKATHPDFEYQPLFAPVGTR